MTRVNRRTGTLERAVELQTIYTYDALNRRIIRSLDTDGTGPNPAVVEKYAYDGDNLYLQFDDQVTIT